MKFVCLLITPPLWDIRSIYKYAAVTGFASPSDDRKYKNIKSFVRKELEAQFVHASDKPTSSKYYFSLLIIKAISNLLPNLITELHGSQRRDVFAIQAKGVVMNLI